MLDGKETNVEIDANVSTLDNMQVTVKGFPTLIVMLK